MFLFYSANTEPGLDVEPSESSTVAFFLRSQPTYMDTLQKKRPVMFCFPTHITLFPELDLKHRETEQKRGKNNVGHFWQMVCVCVWFWWRHFWWEASSQDAGCNH